MKLALAATVLAPSVSALSASLPDPAGESSGNAVDDASLAVHRGLAVSTEHKQDITSILKERRKSKRENSKVIRNLRNKLKRSKLRNLVEEDGATSDVDLDLGFFSRDLQENATEPEEEPSVIEELMEICEPEVAVPGFSCSCSNMDIDAYTANVVCTYESNCLNPTPNSCQGNVTFCFVETYELEVVAPGAGSTKVCYEVYAPLEFNYCYGLSYAGVEGTATGCFLEVDDTPCNFCEFSTDPSYPNVTCNTFDCTNIDDAIADGTVCGDNTIVTRKLYDYLVYGPLPCEGGCNICPGNGEMMSLESSVQLVTGETYFCSQLNLAALMGELQGVPGDLCNALPAIVDGPCECMGGETTIPVIEDTPEEAPTETEAASDDNPADVPDSAAALSSTGVFTVAAGVASVFSWMMA
jgi:hypothetical protein